MGSKRILVVFLLIAAFGFSAKAQRWSISTNAVDYANFLTLNFEASYSVQQHVTVNAGIRYNPWEFETQWSSQGVSEKAPIYNKQITAFAGARYWPWYTYSGWWIGGKLQFSRFATTGVWSYSLKEGEGMGLGFSAGYTWMITSHFNIEAGIGAWGGYLWDYNWWSNAHKSYCYDSNARGFFDLDDIFVSFIYVF